jgi:hypothetical protein
VADAQELGEHPNPGAESLLATFFARTETPIWNPTRNASLVKHLRTQNGDGCNSAANTAQRKNRWGANLR